MGLDRDARRKGELIGFNTTGEVQVTDNRSDRARRPARRARLPVRRSRVSAPALIGRVGNSQPFGIGDQTSVPMPFDGILYLMVNDDERSDNAGQFVVSLSRSRR